MNQREKRQRTAALQDASEPRSLLVRGVNWLGDAVMTSPAMQRLRERFPNTRITLLSDEKLGELWIHHAGVDSVMTFNRADNPWSIARRLGAQRFEAALVLPNSPRSALEVWLAGIPRRYGYAGRWRNWFLTQAVPHPVGRLRLARRSVREVKRLIHRPNLARAVTGGASYGHQSHDYLHLAAAFGANPDPLPPKLEVSADEIAVALAEIRGLPRAESPGKDDSPRVLLGLNPSAAYGPAKRWPVGRFAEVIREISERVPNCIWLTFGAAADWDLCEEVARLAKGQILNLAGKTSLRQMMALLKACRVLLTNDSGPMHVAAALGTPVVVPFGSTSPELTGPGLPGDPRHHILRSNAACAPCFRRACPIDFRCMTGIPAERAVAAIMKTLGVVIEPRLQ
jgi:lipopolysaccharide heptosyltransferase II